MLSANKIPANPSDDNPSVPNFRVFDQNGYSSASITEEPSGHPLLIYSMISIFNGLFSRFEPVKYMMEETDKLLSNSSIDLPIFFINSAELQRITQTWMHPHVDQKKSDPIKNAEKKWLDKHQRSEAALQKERKPFSHQILAWKSISSLPDYDAIPISIGNENHPVRPILSYPISAAKERLAEKTLSDFLKVQELYHKYAQELGLPIIRKKLTLIDSIVPSELCRKKEKNLHANPSPSGTKHAESSQSSDKTISPLEKGLSLSSCALSIFHNTEAKISPAIKIYR